MIGFWVFLALAIPVAVHIFSRSEGKVVPFPFLGLLPKQAAPNELQIQLRQKWLLLVRLLLVASACALLTLALLSDWWSESWLKKSLAQALSLPSSPPTLVITQDWWTLSSPKSQQTLLTALTSEQSIAKTQEVILIHYANAKEKISRVDKSDFISLAQQNKVFTQAGTDIARNDTVNNNSDAAVDARKSTMQLRLIDNIWSIVQAISTTVPKDSLIHVYTSNRHSQFIGVRPYIEHALKWHINGLPDADATATEKAPIQVAIIRTDQLSNSSQTLFLLEQALSALGLMHPIEIDIIEADAADYMFAQATPDNANSSSPSADDTITRNEKRNATNAKQLSYVKYDALIVDFSLSHTTRVHPNAVSLSSLPPPSELEFIAALGQVVFAKRQGELALFSTSILNEQIEMNDKSSVSDPAVVSPLANPNEPPWQRILILVLLILFVLERLMSESLKFAQTTATLNDNGTLSKNE